MENSKLHHRKKAVMTDADRQVYAKLFSSALDVHLPQSYVQRQKIARQAVEDVILQVLETQVAATAQEILAELAKYPRGTLKGSATSITSLRDYIKRMCSAGYIVKASTNLFVLNKEHWTAQELTLIANRVYPTAEVEILGDNEVSITLEKHTYVKDIRIPCVAVIVSLKMQSWLESIVGEIPVPAFTSVDGKEYFHDVKKNLGMLEDVARAYRDFNYQFSIVWEIKEGGKVEINDKGNW